MTTLDGPAPGDDMVDEPSETRTQVIPNLAEQALIEQATGILAERLHLTVTDAAATLAGHAHRRGLRLVDLARATVDGSTDLSALGHQAGRLRAIRQVLAGVCARAGLDPRGAELLRWVGNAVFRLARHPVVVKIVLTPDLAHRADTAVAAARLLAAHEVPAIRLWPGIEQPLHVGQHAATLWHRESHADAEPTITELARLLTQLHGLRTAGTELPAWDPVPDLRHRIADAEHTDPDDVAFLLDCCDQLDTQLSTLDYVLPAGVVHGDAHLGNLIPTRRGPIWCDLDGTSIGPAEWDLTPIAVAQLRFPQSADRHRQLADAYGFDVTTWAGFPVLRRLRELKLVASALPVAASNPAVANQLRHRLRSFRAGDSAAWTRYS